MTPDEYIAFLEGNGIRFLEYQKILLRKLITTEENYLFLIPARHCGWSVLRTLVEIYKTMTPVEERE